MTDETTEAKEQANDETLTEDELEGKYPKHLRTEFSEVDLTCPKCRSVWYPAVARFINDEESPAGREGILRKTIHKSRCPACKGHEYDIMQSFDYYFTEENLIVQVRPPWEIRAGGDEYYWDRMEDLVQKYAADDLHVDVVFGLDEFIEKYLGGTEAVDAAMQRRQREIDLKLRPGDIISDEDMAKYADGGREA